MKMSNSCKMKSVPMKPLTKSRNIFTPIKSLHYREDKLLHKNQIKTKQNKKTSTFLKDSIRPNEIELLKRREKPLSTRHKDLDRDLSNHGEAW